jgi:hypothetical protein
MKTNLEIEEQGPALGGSADDPHYVMKLRMEFRF